MTSERKVINLAERKQQRMAGTVTTEQAAQEVDIPDFITPPDILKMTDAQIEQMLNLVRIRRLSASMMYERTKMEATQREQTKTLAMLDKKADQVFSELEKCLKYIDKLELRVAEMRALRLQAGLEF